MVTRDLPAALRRSESAAREAQRWRDAVHRWVQPTSLPATREQLMAHLLTAGAPNWLVWRVSARLHPTRVFATVEDVLAGGQASRRSPSPAQGYAG